MICYLVEPDGKVVDLDLEGAIEPLVREGRVYTRFEMRAAPDTDPELFQFFMYTADGQTPSAAAYSEAAGRHAVRYAQRRLAPELERIGARPIRASGG